MTNTDKTNIIIEITKIIDRRNKRWNSKKEVVDVFNAWSNSTKYKITDLNFLAWVLSYIEDMLKIDTEIIKEIVEVENKQENEKR